MIKIGDTLVSFDLVEKFFCCDLDSCHGECCIAGDAGAPLTDDEDRRLKEMISEIKPLLAPGAVKAIE